MLLKRAGKVMTRFTKLHTYRDDRHQQQPGGRAASKATAGQPPRKSRAVPTTPSVLLLPTPAIPLLGTHPQELRNGVATGNPHMDAHGGFIQRTARGASVRWDITQPARGTGCQDTDKGISVITSRPSDKHVQRDGRS